MSNKVHKNLIVEFGQWLAGQEGSDYHGWSGPRAGLYWAEAVEWHLMGRGIDPQTLPIVRHLPPGTPAG